MIKDKICLWDPALNEIGPAKNEVLSVVNLSKQAEALEWLEKPFIEQRHWRAWFRLTPELDSLRSNLRFTELLQR